MIEKYLIGHCSPTLASLKTANLMNIPFESMTQLESSINKTNDELNNKGVELIILKKSDKSALVYAFRKSRLQNDLNQNGVKDFLADYGYKSIDVDCCIKRLKSRLKSNDSFLTKSEFFSATHSPMLKDLLKMQAKTANAQVVGKYIAMNVKQ